jgi:hypothetical protein
VFVHASVRACAWMCVPLKLGIISFVLYL